MTNITCSYSDLIKEAFIEPIRNVTVIDDEYPTLSSLIDYQLSKDGSVTESESPYKNVNVERLKKIITMCHSTYKWSVDVFNGQTPKIGGTEDIPSHIHHSDLIILDYHLDGEPSSDDGQRARDIIGSLDNNNHFNIILVHTKGYSGEIADVYKEILRDFVRIDSSHPLLPTKATIDTMDEWMSDNEEGRGHQWIEHEINLLPVLSVYFKHNPERIINPRNPQNPLSDHMKDIKDISDSSGVSIEEIIKWRFLELLKTNGIRIEGNGRSDIKWGWGDDSNYISTGKTFISVIKKSADAPDEDLVTALNAALVSHNASPMHLLMAKMRFELDERGIEQALKIIENRPAQAGWLYNLLENSSSDAAHDKAINLHWEQLAMASRLELRNFSKKIVQASNCKNSNENREFVKMFFTECMGNKDLTLGLLNAFSCSMPVTNNHLKTGTVIEIEGDKWVCVTPACDMVPGQKVEQWKSRIGENYLAFKAVKLISASLENANNDANCNGFIFLNINNIPQAYTLGNEHPIWDTFFAGNLGRYNSDQIVSVFAVRDNPEIEGSPLSIKELQSKAIAELRYEYALNLLHRFGASQTRVGLDFQDKRSMWA
ncbi:response regulator receiver domain [Citrobacter freundii]|uniref:response regulator receiver domain n=1 Tax=Citrobacter freundii TaxID=546 RepID=UPI001BD06912|nr:response regulator receiver domain [Citrobacter freundii]